MELKQLRKKLYAHVKLAVKDKLITVSESYTLRAIIGCTNILGVSNARFESINNKRNMLAQNATSMNAELVSYSTIKNHVRNLDKKLPWFSKEICFDGWKNNSTIIIDIKGLGL